MKPIYKRVQILKEHCPKCGEQLKGNGSYALPWNCSCGEWKFIVTEENLIEYKII